MGAGFFAGRGSTWGRAVTGLLLCAALGCGGSRDGVQISPTRGDIRDGVDVRISGQGFRAHGRVEVFFGTRAAKAVVLESDGLIRARAPIPFAAGPVVVSLQFEDGTTMNAAPEFVYEIPQGMTIKSTPVGPQIDGSTRP